MSKSPFDKLKSLKSNSSEEVAAAPSQTHHHAHHETTPQEATSPSHPAVSHTSPASSTGRVSSGIPGYDALMEGGYVQGSLNLIAGGAGTGKTLFAMHFIYDGLMKGEKGMFISFSERKEELYTAFRALGFDLKKHEDEGNFIFLEYTPEQVDKVLNEGGGSFDELIDKSKHKRVVLDSISAFLLLDSSERSKKESVLSLFKMLRGWNATSLLTEDYPFEEEGTIFNTSSSIEYEVDSISFLYNLSSGLGENRKRMIEVYKMRLTNHALKAVEYAITDEGIEVLR